MNKTQWILKQVWKDGKKNYKWVLKGIGLVMIVIFVIKSLLLNIDKGIIFPMLWILLVIGIIYHWDSMSDDMEQMKIIEKLKEGK